MISKLVQLFKCHFSLFNIKRVFWSSRLTNFIGIKLNHFVSWEIKAKKKTNWLFLYWNEEHKNCCGWIDPSATWTTSKEGLLSLYFYFQGFILHQRCRAQTFKTKWRRFSLPSYRDRELEMAILLIMIIFIFLISWAMHDVSKITFKSCK